MIETTYAKLFSSLVTSTIWREDDKTRIVWITMLALKNRHGDVAGSIPGLAAMANVAVDDCVKALEKLKAPDPYSRSKEFQGCRISEIEGGWHVLNHKKYRAAMSEEARREYKRLWQAEHRKRKSVDKNVDTKMSISTQADADTEAEASKTNTHHEGRPRNMQAVLERAAITGCPPAEAERFWHHYESSGWVDKNGNVIANWQSKLAIWATDARARPLEQAHKGQSPQLSNMDKSIFSKEFDIVVAKMKSIRDSYMEHQAWSESDVVAFRELKARRDELKKLLGMQV